MEKDVWIRRWRAKALEMLMDKLSLLKGPRGLESTKFNALLDAPAELDALLARMYDDLQPKVKPNENSKRSTVGENEARPQLRAVP